MRKKNPNEYITFRRYTHKALSGRELDIPAGQKLYNHYGVLILPNNEPVCTTHSQNARQIFAPNYDDNGIERGKLTYAIAYEPRRTGFRFNATEREYLEKNWPQYLQGGDTLLFNDDFFRAPIIHLRAIADWLNIKPTETAVTLRSDLLKRRPQS